MVLIPTECEEYAIDHMYLIGIRLSWMDSVLGLSGHDLSNINRKRKRLMMDEGNIKSLTSSDWSGLPEVLLLLIRNKLTCIRDCISISAVCTYWQQVCRHNRPSHLPRQLPVLMIPNYEEQALHFVSPFAGKTRKKRLYDLANIRIALNDQIIGSSEGWLVIVSRRDPNYVSLLNPFLSVNNYIRLPPPLLRIPMSKVALSASPSSNSDCVVAGIYPAGLAFCRPNAKTWTTIDLNWYCEVITYYKDEFYVVTREGHVKAFNFHTPNPVLRLVAVLPYFPQHNPNNTQKYLVESLGDLIMVVRQFLISRPYPLKSTTVGCKIYKMNSGTSVWNEVKTLESCTLFLGGISSMSVYPSQFPGSCCKPNSIYFGCDTTLSGCSDVLDSVIFGLENSTIEPLVHARCTEGPIWIEPKL